MVNFIIILLLKNVILQTYCYYMSITHIRALFCIYLFLTCFYLFIIKYEENDVNLSSRKFLTSFTERL